MLHRPKVNRFPQDRSLTAYSACLSLPAPRRECQRQLLDDDAEPHQNFIPVNARHSAPLTRARRDEIN
jgi:hypothetical protein